MYSLSSEKTKSYALQQATAYCVYMMAGSFFHRTRNMNGFLVERMYMHYAEMPANRRVKLEDRILKQLEKLRLGRMDDLDCCFVAHYIGEDYCLDFLTGGFGWIRVVVQPDGRLNAVGE